MIPRLSLRRLTAFLAVVAILFAQTATAAHACSAALAGAMPAAHGAMDHSMHDAHAHAGNGGHDGHDGGCCDAPPGIVQDDLCFQHCLTAPQAAGDPPAAAPGAPAAGTARHAAHHHPAFVDLRDHSRALLAHVTAPPIAVRNCCFRT